MWAFGFIFFTSVIMIGAGCASLSGSRDEYLVCPYDTVWEAALETMKDRPVTVHDKEKGLIETSWVEMEAAERPFGVFARDAFDNKERARMTVSVKPMNEVTTVNVLESRQRWHLRGGVTQQATKWWPVEPSEEAMAAVMNKLNAKLKERGCSPT